MDIQINVRTIIKDLDIDWEEVAKEMKQGVRLSSCEYAGTKYKGFFNKLVWICKNKIHNDDLCESKSSDKKGCTAWLANKFDVKKEKAKVILNHINDLDWINFSDGCGAVFFNV